MKISRSTIDSLALKTAEGEIIRIKRYNNYLYQLYRNLLLYFNLISISISDFNSIIYGRSYFNHTLIYINLFIARKIIKKFILFDLITPSLYRERSKSNIIFSAAYFSNHHRKYFIYWFRRASTEISDYFRFRFR